MGKTSREFYELQGVRQGGVWSPTAYKVFINSLLTTLEESKIETNIGSIYCGAPTVADDVTLVAKDPYDLQTMINVQSDHANKNRYFISHQKSCVLKMKDNTDHNWSMNGEKLDTPESAIHLGISRDNKSKFGVKDVVPDRIQTARKTVYALMGAGLHGLNGLNPVVSLQLIRCYVTPRLLYGLDVIHLTKTDVQKLSTYYTKLLKQIQHLPERTSTSAVHLITGQLPIEAEIHKKKLVLMRNISVNEGSVENEIAWRQLAMKSSDSNSWFIELVRLAELYELPSPHFLIANKTNKDAWRKLVSANINKHWSEKLKLDASNKSTLKHLNYEDCQIGKVHSVWYSCGTEKFEVTRACVKAKLLCGVYLLQSDKSKFSRQPITSLCPLCMNDIEDRQHFLLTCKELSHIRDRFLLRIRECLLNEINASLVQEILGSNELLLQLVIDSSKFHFIDKNMQVELDSLTRGMCYAMHHHRSTIVRTK